MEWAQSGATGVGFTSKLIFSFPAAPCAQSCQNHQTYRKAALPDHLLDDGASHEDSRQQRE